MSNTDYTKANAYMAEKCGVYVTDSLNNVAPSWLYYDNEGNCITILDLWTITDPRCRQIIRERFGISTISNHAQGTKNRDDQWYWAETHKHSGKGKTIAEAEIAAILLIVEAQDNG